jgi:hypothetical protein
MPSEQPTTRAHPSPNMTSALLRCLFRVIIVDVLLDSLLLPPFLLAVVTTTLRRYIPLFLFHTVCATRSALFRILT